MPQIVLHLKKFILPVLSKILSFTHSKRESHCGFFPLSVTSDLTILPSL